MFGGQVNVPPNVHVSPVRRIVGFSMGGHSTVNGGGGLQVAPGGQCCPVLNTRQLPLGDCVRLWVAVGDEAEAPLVVRFAHPNERAVTAINAPVDVATVRFCMD